MHFCGKCDNLYYIRIADDDENQLIYYCRKCGNEEKNIISSLDNICVSKSEKNDSDSSYKHIINKYTKYDPTLPRIHNIKCPNNACISNTGDKGESKDVNIKDDNGESESKMDGADIDSKELFDHEILYLRYDDANMKFVYICSSCDTIWKSSDNK